MDIPEQWMQRVQAVVDEAHTDNLGGEHVEGFCKACAAAYLVAQIAVPHPTVGAVSDERQGIADEVRYGSRGMSDVVGPQIRAQLADLITEPATPRGAVSPPLIAACNALAKASAHLASAGRENDAAEAHGASVAAYEAAHQRGAVDPTKVGKSADATTEQGSELQRGEIDGLRAGISWARGMCSDSEPHEQIDAFLGRLLDPRESDEEDAK